jgi:hypothetical protein
MERDNKWESQDTDQCVIMNVHIYAPEYKENSRKIQSKLLAVAISEEEALEIWSLDWKFFLFSP